MEVTLKNDGGVNVTHKLDIDPIMKALGQAEEIIGFAQDILADLKAGRFKNDPAHALKTALETIADWKGE